MKRTALQVRIVFNFFEPGWCVRTLLVATGDVTGDRLAFRFRLSAFEDDKLACHRYSLFFVLRFFRFFFGFFSVTVFFFAVGEAEK